MRKSVAVVVPVLAILLSILGSTALAQTCGCCRDSLTVDACPEATDFIAGRDACLGAVEDTFSTCMNRCNPADSVQGRCAWIRNCLDTCRAIRTRQIGGCWTRYRTQVRGTCPRGTFASAKKASRRCQNGRTPPCDCPVLPTTTTSTTTSTTGSPSTTTVSTTITTTTAPPSGLTMSSSAGQTADAGVPAAASDCQGNCIFQIVRACYRNCGRSCGVDFVARSFCQRFCRNANCRFLLLSCTDNGSPESGEYRACCNQFDNCESEEDATFCQVTTTTTSSTSTTTTSSVTTTSSIFASTTSSTAFGATTTSSTTPATLSPG